jgi:hypothetical protein
VPGMEVVVALLGESGEQLILQGEDELAGEHPEIRVPLLSLATAFGGRH